jgi:hypothetical protein
MLRVFLEFRDGRDPLDVTVETYIRLPDDMTDGVARFYADCDCGIQHPIECGAALAAAVLGTHPPCAAAGPQ